MALLMPGGESDFNSISWTFIVGQGLYVQSQDLNLKPRPGSFHGPDSAYDVSPVFSRNTREHISEEDLEETGLLRAEEEMGRRLGRSPDAEGRHRRQRHCSARWTADPPLCRLVTPTARWCLHQRAAVTPRD